MNNKIILGTAQFGSKYGLNSKKTVKLIDCKKIINFALKNNINYIDTAMNYNESYKILSKIGCKKFKVITKIGNFDSSSSLNILKLNKKIKKNLQDFKIKNFEAVLFHQENFLLSKTGEKVFKFLLELKKNKIINKIGVSIYNFPILKKIINYYDIDVVQCPVNVFDNDFISHEAINLFKKNNKIEVHARSIFLQGLLLLKTVDIPDKFYRYRRYFNLWNSFLFKNNISNLKYCLNFVKKNKFINRIIVGVQDEAQLDMIIKNYKIKSYLKKIKFDIQDKKLLKPYLWPKD